jgi:hypothetical protein
MKKTHAKDFFSNYEFSFITIQDGMPARYRGLIKQMYLIVL